MVALIRLIDCFRSRFLFCVFVCRWPVFMEVIPKAKFQALEFQPNPPPATAPHDPEESRYVSNSKYIFVGFHKYVL